MPLILERRITAAHVKAEAARRIEVEYPVWKQMNLIREGQADAMGARIDAIRARSNAIEALTPIPLDYTADKHWR